MTSPEDLVGLTYETAWIKSGGAAAEIVKDDLETKLKSIVVQLGFNPHKKVRNIDDARLLFGLAGAYEPNVVFSDHDGNKFETNLFLDRPEKPGFLGRLKQKHPVGYDLARKLLVVGAVVFTVGLAGCLGSAPVKKPEDKKPEFPKVWAVVYSDYEKSSGQQKTHAPEIMFQTNLDSSNGELSYVIYKTGESSPIKSGKASINSRGQAFIDISDFSKSEPHKIVATAKKGSLSSTTSFETIPQRCYSEYHGAGDPIILEIKNFVNETTWKTYVASWREGGYDISFNISDGERVLAEWKMKTLRGNSNVYEADARFNSSSFPKGRLLRADFDGDYKGCTNHASFEIAIGHS
ncbi:MAG: hypothetical protein HYT16_01905 [DPANN group archaeon]|nr:hypothetical protein [DPANN group archaeon]